MSKRDRERRRHKLPRYAAGTLAAAEALAAGALRPGHVYTVPVYHDDGCALLAGKGACDCNPEVGAPERVPDPREN